MTRCRLDGDKIRMLREEKGFSQERLAEELSVFAEGMGEPCTFSRQSIQHWEKGRNNGNVSSIKVFAQFFGVEKKELMQNVYQREESMMMQANNDMMTLNRDMNKYRAETLMECLKVLQDYYYTISDAFVDRELFLGEFYDYLPKEMYDALDPDTYDDIDVNAEETYADWVKTIVQRRKNCGVDGYEQYIAVKKVVELCSVICPDFVTKEMDGFLKNHCEKIAVNGRDYFEKTLKWWETLEEHHPGAIICLEEHAAQDKESYIEEFCPELVALKKEVDRIIYQVIKPCFYM